MSIPANITTELASLQTQVAAAKPLNAAPRATVQAIKLNAAQLVSDVQTELVAPNNLLDTWAAPVDPAAIVAGVLQVAEAGNDQNALALMRGVVGRAASNINQVAT